MDLSEFLKTLLLNKPVVIINNDDESKVLRLIRLLMKKNTVSKKDLEKLQPKTFGMG